MNEFIILAQDARDKKLDLFSSAASKLHGETFNPRKLVGYPTWFIQHVLEKHSNRGDLCISIGAILRKAIVSQDQTLISLVRNFVSNKELSFKGKVLDELLQ